MLTGIDLRSLICTCEIEVALNNPSLISYWAVRQVIGRAFVCLFLELASWPCQSAELPTAKAKLATPGIFSKKSLPISCRTAQYIIFNPLSLPEVLYWAVRQLIGRDFSENIPGVASFALAVGSSADWLDHEASSKSKHTKAFPMTCRTTQYTLPEPLPLDEKIWVSRLTFVARVFPLGSGIHLERN